MFRDCVFKTGFKNISIFNKQPNSNLNYFVNTQKTFSIEYFPKNIGKKKQKNFHWMKFRVILSKAKIKYKNKKKEDAKKHNL